MNRKLLLFLSFALLANFTVFAEGEDDERRRRRSRRGKGTAQQWEVETNPLAYIWGDYNFNGKYLASENIAYIMHVSYTSFDFSGIGWNGFYIAPEARYYFEPKTQNDGWFGGAYLKYRTNGTTGEPYTAFSPDGDIVAYDLKSNALAVGFTFGRTWVTDFGMEFTLYGGSGYALIYDETESKPIEEDPTFEAISNVVSRIDFQGGVGIGYRF
jgi:hypothetical protein